MSKIRSATFGVLNLRSRHASRSVYEKQNVALFELYLNLSTIGCPEGQFTLFVKGEKFFHLDS